jgi:curved DNA-binding protein CbpA
MKDYYRTLGVLDDAEDIIIRAAYKALAQRYHPDKWKGDPQEANKRMSDINEAYDVLSDVDRRKNYDEEYFSNHPKNQAEEEPQSPDYEDIPNEDIEGWSIAESFFPEIKRYYEELKKFSPLVANTFRSHLLANKDFNNSLEIKNQLESDYFERYYGSDRQIQRYAKSLLLNKHYKAAIQINKFICILGSSVTFRDIKSKIEDAYPEVVGQSSSANVGKEREALITSVKNDYLSPYELCDLYKQLYGSPLEVKNSLFKSTYIAFIDGVRVQLDSGDLKRKLLAKI